MRIAILAILLVGACAQLLGTRATLSALVVCALAVAFLIEAQRYVQYHPGKANINLKPQNDDDNKYENHDNRPRNDDNSTRDPPPQDAPYQVPRLIDDGNFRHIAAHEDLHPSIADLDRASERRPASVQLSLTILEEFLAAHAWLCKKSKRVGKVPTNSVVHEVVKQRATDLLMLRAELLEQLQQSLLEFTAPVKGADRAIAFIRDYTHAMCKEMHETWRRSVPSLSGTIAPPYALPTMTSSSTVYI